VLLRERYQLGELLGESVFARTYVGRDVRDDADVIVKELPVRGLPNWKPVELLQREAAVLRSLSHPGVPRLIDAFHDESGGSAYLVIERVPGQTLASLIARGRRWDPASARELLEQLLETLVYLHGLSPPVIHRDIKPSNVVVRPDGRPVLVDFGSVRDLAAGDMTVVGTAGYMPPEQAIGRATPASDIYSLGATMIHALTHRHPAELPHDGLTLRFRDQVGIPDRFAVVLERMLEPDLRRRYDRARAVLADLRGETQLAGPRPSEPLGIVPPPAAPRPVPVALERRLTSLTTMSAGGAAAAVLGTSVATLVGAPVLAHVLFGALSVSGYALTLGGLLLLVGGANVTMFTRLRAGYRRLYRDGLATEGTIRAITVDATDPRKARIAFTYEVDSTPFAGTLVTSDPADLRLANLGGPISVVFDPARPARHVAVISLPPAGVPA
jgi:hypothetical protein